MHRTYSEASEVIVFDSYMSQAASTLTTTEAVLVWHCSKYERRLWTLAKRWAAADRLYLQFEDSAVGLAALKKLAGRSQEEVFADHQSNGDFRAYLKSPWSPLTLCKSWTEFVHMAGQCVLSDQREAEFQVLHHKLKPAITLEHIFRFFSFRQTSKAPDEALCIAQILDLQQLGSIAIEKEASERMRKLWSMLDFVPDNIIYWGVPRLKSLGSRWAPATLLTSQSIESMLNMPAYALGPGVSTEYGLKVLRPGLRFHMDRRSIKLPQLTLNNSENGRFYSLFLYQWTSVKDWLDYEGHKLFIGVEPMNLVVLWNGTNSLFTGTGVLIRCYRTPTGDAEQVEFGHILCRVAIKVRSKPQQNNLNPGGDTITCELTGERKWCID